MSTDAATSVVKDISRGPGLPPRWWRGILCGLSFLVAPLGWALPRHWFQRISEEHLDRGLVLILPGVEGRSFLNFAILQGLIDADLPYALEVFDWTTGWKPLFIYHLRAWRRNQRMAQQLAERIVAYRRDYPGRPVWIVGHSGGGGMALLTAAALPDDMRITGLVLLAPAVSPRFDISAAMQKVERGIWSFHSWRDFLWIGLGTSIFGCFDGRYGPAAGMVGFRNATENCQLSDAVDEAAMTLPATATTAAEFQQICHTWEMLSQFHAGGHFGCTHRVFVAETVAPILLRAPEK